jgi:hypothetical protein
MQLTPKAFKLSHLKGTLALNFLLRFIMHHTCKGILEVSNYFLNPSIYTSFDNSAVT